MITSISNSLVKLAISLHHKKGRMTHNLYLAEGIHLVTEALNAGVGIARFIWTSKLALSSEGCELLRRLSEAVPGVEVSETVFNKIAETDNPQGVVAFIEILQETMPDFSKIQLGLVVDGVQDPGNVGTIIRTAWAANVDSLFFTPGTSDPYQGKVVRATMGGIFTQRIFRNVLPASIFQQAVNHGITIVGGYPEATQSHFQLNFSGPTMFLIGNEGKGISEEWANFSIQKVYIPQPGKAESLNVAVSAGILIYEAIRQRLTMGACKN